MHSYQLIFWFLGAIAFTLGRLAYDEWRQYVRYGAKARHDGAAALPMMAREAGQKKGPVDLFPAERQAAVRLRGSQPIMAH